METFDFAGFTFPRIIPMLPKGTMRKRLEKRRAPKLTGPYYTAPTPNTDGANFYLDSDFMPGLRWQWADEVSGVRIDHTGWWTDEDGGGDTIRGIVMRLPKSRGFIAGWSMGENMASSVAYRVFEDEREAARAADDEARVVAENEREYHENEEEENEEE